MNTDGIELFFMCLGLLAYVLAMASLLILILFNDKNRKKAFRITWYVLTALTTAGAIAVPIAAFRKLSVYFDISGTSSILETVSYLLISCCYLLLFGLITKKMRTRVKFILGAAASLLFVTEVFLLNNLFKSASGMWWMKEYGYGFPDAFSYYAKTDLGYSLGLGIFRYVLAFLAQYALTGVVIFIKTKQFVKMREALRYKVLIPFYLHFHRCELSELILLHGNNRIGFKAIAEYCESMVFDRTTMCEVLHCLNRYEEIFLYDLLFFGFGDYLNKKQYLKYRKKYSGRFSKEPIESCRALDVKYGVEYAGEYRQCYWENNIPNGGRII